MNRLLTIALIVFSAPAFAQDRGPRVVDVRSFGASPTAASSVNRKAFQDAFAYLAATAQRDGVTNGTVYIPSGKFRVDRPVIVDTPYISIRGEGVTSQIYGSGGHDVFVYGVKRDVGVPVDPAHFPDLFTAGPNGAPALDASAVPSAGRRWGLRTMADSHLIQQGGALDVGGGDSYRSVGKLTIDAKFDLGRITPTNRAQGCLFGITENGHPRPFSFTLANGYILLQFRTTTDADQFDQGTDRSVYICPVDATTGWVALTVQIDLATATVAAWRDGKQIKVTVPSGPGWAPGLKFATNEHTPFGLGSNSGTATSIKDVWGGPTDITFAGLHLSSSAPYVVGTEGSAQARVDGKPITDASRYFTRTNDTIGLLPLTDMPASIAADRIVGVTGKSGLETSAYWFSNLSHGTPYATITANRLQDVAIMTNSLVYGRGIATGWTGGLSIRDSYIAAGHQAVGCINVGANYPVTIQHCTLSASDSAVYLYFSAFATIDDVEIRGAPRCSLRFVRCEPVIRNIRGVYGSAEYLVKSVGGGFRIFDAFWDDESEGGAKKAAFYSSAQTQETPLGSQVIVDNVSAGNTAPGRPLIVLDDNGQATATSAYPRGIFDCRRLIIYPRAGVPAPIVVAGDRWSGSISADMDLPGVEWVRASGKSPKVKVIPAPEVMAPPVPISTPDAAK